MSNHTLRQACPNCGRPNDTVAELKERQGGPSPGDPVICIQCGVVSVIDENMNVVIASVEMQSKWPEKLRNEVKKALELLRIVKHRQN